MNDLLYWLMHNWSGWLPWTVIVTVTSNSRFSQHSD